MRIANSLAIATGLAVFAVLAGTTASSALWSSPASTSSTVKVANLTDSCSNVTSVINASFEEPYVTGLSQTSDTLVPGWVATPDHNIEIWVNGSMGVPAPVGRQFVELNAHVAGTLTQSISTTPGQTLQWSLLHRGRAGVDTMAVLIGASDATLVSQGNISDGTAAWNRYSGAYVVPAGQTTTQLSFRAISTATGDQSIGNFLDDVSFGSGPCLTAVSSPVANITNPGGAVRVGDTIQYETTVRNVGSSPALQTRIGNTLPAELQFVPGTLTVGGVAQTDAAGDDTGQSVNGTIAAYLGVGATATVGGSLAQGTEMKYTFRAVVQPAAAGTTINFAPTGSYVNGLATGWPLSVTAANVAVAVAPSADLAVTGATSTATVNKGSATPVTWTFTVLNNGPSNAAGAKLRISVPSTITAAAPSGSNVTCAVVTTNPLVYDCTTTSVVVPGYPGTVTITGTVAAAAAVGSTHAVSGVVSATTGDPVAANNSASTAVTVNDTQAPSAPGTLTASGTTASQTTLSWPVATDNVAVTGYDVYRNGVFITTVTALSYTNTGLTPSTAYTYYVRARDLAGNVGVPSNTVAVTTPSALYRMQAVTTTSTTTWWGGTVVTTYCINAEGGGTGNGTLLNIRPCATSTSQSWRMTPTTNGYVTVTPQYSTTLGWDVDGASTTDYSRVLMWTYGGGLNQQWLQVDEGNGRFHFVNRNSGKCLDIPNNNPSNGLGLQQYTCNGSTAQSFILTAP